MDSVAVGPRASEPAGVPGPLDSTAVAVAGALCAAGGALVPAAVRRLPRPRDVPVGVEGPDYRGLSRRRGLGAACAALGGLAGLALGARFGGDPALPALCYLVVAGLVLSYVDLCEHRLPDAVLAPTAAVLAVALGAAAAVEGTARPLLGAALGAAASSGFLLVAVLARPDGLGLGDVKLAAVTGGLLGWWSASAVVVGMLAGLALGGLAGAMLIVFRRASRRTSIALGPALLAGALLAALLQGP